MPTDAISVPIDEAANSGFVVGGPSFSQAYERGCGPRLGFAISEQVLDPVAGQVPEVGRGVADDDGVHPVGVVERELRGDDAAERAAPDDRALDAEGVHESAQVAGEVRHAPLARRAGGAASSAAVEGHEAIGLREDGRLEEQPGRVVVRLKDERGALAERLVEQLHPVSAHPGHS